MKLPTLLPLAFVPLLALSSCQLPGSAFLSAEQFQDPAYVGTNCIVSPMDFKRQLVVRAPSVGIPVMSGFAKANLQGLSDNGQTSLYMVLTRRGSSWYWLKVPPSITLPNDTTIEAIRLTTDVGRSGSVAETYIWNFTREQAEEFAQTGLLGDIQGGPRVGFPAAYFSGFLQRWDTESETAYGSTAVTP